MLRGVAVKSLYKFIEWLSVRFNRSDDFCDTSVWIFSKCQYVFSSARHRQCRVRSFRAQFRSTRDTWLKMWPRMWRRTTTTGSLQHVWLSNNSGNDRLLQASSALQRQCPSELLSSLLPGCARPRCLSPTHLCLLLFFCCCHGHGQGPCVRLV